MPMLILIYERLKSNSETKNTSSTQFQIIKKKGKIFINENSEVKEGNYIFDNSSIRTEDYSIFIIKSVDDYSIYMKSNTNIFINFIESKINLLKGDITVESSIDRMKFISSTVNASLLIKTEKSKFELKKHTPNSLQLKVLEGKLLVISNKPLIKNLLSQLNSNVSKSIDSTSEMVIESGETIEISDSGVNEIDVLKYKSVEMIPDIK
jgi:hypothetical protein